MARPDSRTENVDRLNKHAKNTIEKLNEAQEYLQEHADELSPGEASAIRAKNERRRSNIEALEGEIKEERRVEK
ncbi:small acid-soluble spore protein Tlp [Paenibacillus sp.]|uniref:small acid-soluble spore protein Tlp n=1 Tax=Paenibacillus sp. TaxID=58172 RepID=UPI0028117A60|nr:small acid-soluble spore protein Tlp [Paenibacillus sp.]